MSDAFEWKMDWNSGRLGGLGGVHLDVDGLSPLRAKHWVVFSTRPKGSDASSTHKRLREDSELVGGGATSTPKLPQPTGGPNPPYVGGPEVKPVVAAAVVEDTKSDIRGCSLKIR